MMSVPQSDLAALRADLLAFARRRVPEPDAEDLVQAVLERVVRRADTLRDSERLGAWLHRVAVNATTDYYRRRARRGEILGEPPDLETRDEDENASRFLAGCLPGFIAGLDEKYAQALTWVDLEGLTQAEAARRAGISVSGMKSRVQRGRRLLEDSVRRCCAIEQDARGGVVGYTPRDPCGC